MSRCPGPAKRGRKGDHDIPESFDIRRWSRQQIWDHDVHAPAEAAVRLRGSLAAIARQLLPGARVTTDESAARVARLLVRNLRGLARQALAWGPDAEVIAPAEARVMAREILPRWSGRARGDALTAAYDLCRMRRLLLLLRAAARAARSGRGLPLAEAARITGARSTKQVVEESGVPCFAALDEGLEARVSPSNLLAVRRVAPSGHRGDRPLQLLRESAGVSVGEIVAADPAGGGLAEPLVDAQDRCHWSAPARGRLVGTEAPQIALVSTGGVATMAVPGATCQSDTDCCEVGDSCKVPYDGSSTSKLCCRETPAGCTDDAQCCTGMCWSHYVGGSPVGTCCAFPFLKTFTCASDADCCDSATYSGAYASTQCGDENGVMRCCRKSGQSAGGDPSTCCNRNGAVDQFGNCR